ncbi:MAG: hypothetical protein JKY48_02470 [Flavobacteriales bacterium]|nr:hypothetical protein [Flavobacteriales bacterium]
MIELTEEAKNMLGILQRKDREVNYIYNSSLHYPSEKANPILSGWNCSGSLSLPALLSSFLAAS